MLYFHKLMHFKNYNTNHILWSVDCRVIIGRKTADNLRLSADKSVIKCHRLTVWRSIVGRLAPDLKRATFGRYDDVNFFKTSVDCRPIIGRPSPHASPTKPLKIVGSVNETFNLGASTTKSSTDQTISQNLCQCRPKIDDYPKFCSPTVGRPSVWVM